MNILIQHGETGMQIPGFLYEQLTFIDKQRDNTTSNDKMMAEKRISVVFK